MIAIDGLSSLFLQSWLLNKLNFYIHVDNDHET